MKQISLNQSYYKIRIIITFCSVTILLVLILSFISYRFVRTLYLDQLSDQVDVLTKLISRQINKDYLELLQIGTPTNSAAGYFKKIFSDNMNNNFHSRIFIFNKDLNIIVHSDSGITAGLSEPLLLLNQKEISGLNPGESTVSLPFKGDDDKWYLWGFSRLDNNYWLALKENAARLEKVEDFAVQFFYIGSAGVILTILISWLMARALTKPVDRLVDFSREIGKGNFLAEVPSNTRGELKLLSDSMDKMKEDIEANNKEKEKMLAQIAHEIRNPLGGIELMANLTKEDLVKESKTTEGVEYLNKIICEVNSLKSLITSYLNFSRPLAATPGWIKLDEFCKELGKSSKAGLIRKNINFSYKNKIEKIWFDGSHLKQIFINLMTNSIESANGEGNIYITSLQNGLKWEIIFSDDGPGIDNKNLSHIFDPFFTTKKEGTGLGLAICKKLCSENKAELKAENNKDKGSTFRIIKEIPVE